MFATLSSPLFLTAWASGTATGLGLFAVVGAQSAFILRQGLMRAHLLSVVAICALIDAIFIFARVSGLQALTAWFPWLTTAVLWFGVAFSERLNPRGTIVEDALSALDAVEIGGDTRCCIF